MNGATVAMPDARHTAHDPRRAMLLLTGFALAWVLLEEVVGTRAQGHYPLMQVVWCRYAAHLATLLLLFGWRDPARLWRTSRPVYQLARSLLMLVMPLSFAMALQSGTPPDLVWAVFWLSPLLILWIARRMLGERATRRVWVAAGLGAVASAAMLAPRSVPGPWMFLLPLAMALSFSVYVVMTRSLRTESVHANLFYTALGVFVVLTPFMPAIWVPPSAADAVVLTAIGVVGLLTLLALDRSAAHAPLSRVAPVLYTHLAWLALVDLAVGGHAPSLRTAAAGLLILVSVWYLWVREPRGGVSPAAVDGKSREGVS